MGKDCLLYTSHTANASEQVLTCVADGPNGGDTQVLISESLLSQGRILWPSQAGTAVFNIGAKTAVSYTATEVATKAKTPSRLYLNRLNGALFLELDTSPLLLDTIRGVCSGAVSREACMRLLDTESPGFRAM